MINRLSQFMPILNLRVTEPNPPVSINRIIPRTTCTRPANSIRSQSVRQSKTEPAICCRRKSDRWQLRRKALQRSAKRWTQQMTRATDGFSSHIPIRIKVNCDEVSKENWWKWVDDLLFARRSPTKWLWWEQRVRPIARIGQTSPEYFGLRDKLKWISVDCLPNFLWEFTIAISDVDEFVWNEVVTIVDGAWCGHR